MPLSNTRTGGNVRDSSSSLRRAAVPGLTGAGACAGAATKASAPSGSGGMTRTGGRMRDNTCCRRSGSMPGLSACSGGRVAVAAPGTGPGAARRPRRRSTCPPVRLRSCRRALLRSMRSRRRMAPCVARRYGDRSSDGCAKPVPAILPARLTPTAAVRMLPTSSSELLELPLDTYAASWACAAAAACACCVRMTCPMVRGAPALAYKSTTCPAPI